MNTQKNTFTLSWLISILAILAVGSLVFLSFYFRTGGDSMKGILFSLAVVVVIFLTVISIVKRKKEPSPVFFKKSAMVELLLLFVLLVEAVIVFIMSDHFYTVASRQKVIAESINDQLSQMNLMLDDYDNNVTKRVKAFDAQLQAAESAQKLDPATYISLGLDKYSRKNILSDFKYEISFEKNRNELNKWMKSVEGSTGLLKLVVLMGQTREISLKLESVKTSLKQLDMSRTEGRNGEPWDYSLTVNTTPIQMFTDRGTSMNIWNVFVSLMAMMLICLPYFTARRDGRSNGLMSSLKGQNNNNDTTHIAGI